MFDHTKVRLGKKTPKIDQRTLKLAKYVDALPPPPQSCDWTKGVTSWGMMLNDQLGCCTCSAIGHGAQVVTLNTPTGEETPTDQLVLNLYEKSCGYDPNDPSSDQGGIILEVLNYSKQHGLGHKNNPHHHKKYPLIAYAAPSPRNMTHIKQAIQLFATVDIGIQLPISAQAQVGGLWDVTGNSNNPDSQPGSWGGHSVICSAYDQDTITCITWGALQKMTWNFWDTYVDESYAILYAAWLEHFGTQYPEILKQLATDLTLISN